MWLTPFQLPKGTPGTDLSHVTASVVLRGSSIHLSLACEHSLSTAQLFALEYLQLKSENLRELMLNFSGTGSLPAVSQSCQICSLVFMMLA